jgi:hypothetical protein
MGDLHNRRKPTRASRGFKTGYSARLKKGNDDLSALLAIAAEMIA